jgi:AraC-like DNA-binding protein
MRATPEFLSDRPASPASGVDVLSEVLDAVHLTTAVFGRLSLAAPWRLRVAERESLTFYVVARGSVWLELAPAAGRAERVVLPLSQGDAVLLPRGAAHELRDAERSKAPPEDFDFAACPRAEIRETARFGGAGAVASVVTGDFTFSSAPRNPLLATLPVAIHLPADAAARGPLGGVVPLIVRESTAPGPGSAVALAHLADLLLIHGLRHWTATDGAATCGLRAVADPAIGAALRLMHERPAEPWTVARLAAEMAMSRSAFAARFAALVGEPPLQYLARWRMTLAARLLRDERRSVAEVAGRVGYANAVAFTKAFARVQGVGPGAYRRGERPAA